VQYFRLFIENSLGMFLFKSYIKLLYRNNNLSYRRFKNLECSHFGVCEYLHRIKTNELGIFEDCKDNWHRHFKKLRLKYPKVYGSITASSDITFRFPKKHIVVKPNHGSCGHEVSLIKYVGNRRYEFESELMDEKQLKKHFVNKSKHYIFTQYIDTRCRDGLFCHYRVITYKHIDKGVQIFYIQRNVQYNGHEFRSNGHTKATVFDVTPDKWGKGYYKKMIKMACKAHRSIPVFAVGWDFLIDKRGRCYILEGNFHFGITGCKTKSYESVCEEYINLRHKHATF
jgi:glutathione synthase/RimK-type ligase-like ATP-grasp enzyme